MHGTPQQQPGPEPGRGMSAAAWRSLLPRLEQEAAEDLKQFRKSMRAARILPDYVNQDVFPRGKSGAWEIFFDRREVAGEALSFTIYVRRSGDQLAVNENGGHPFVVTSNFTRAFPWDPPTADDLRRGMTARMRSYGVRPQE